MEENVYIYGLVEKRTRYLRYVGKTNDINRRFRRHISERFLRDTYKDRWIRKLMERGNELEVVLIDSVKKT